MNALRSPFRYVGGKAASAKHIVEALPDPRSYKCYVEPCGGAAHVLIAKPEYNHEEIYNDLDGNLVAFWLEMLEDGAELASRLDQLPYSREIYYTFYKSLFDGTPLTRSERAFRFFYALRGTGTGWMRKSVVGWNPHLAANYRSTLAIFPLIQQRFRNVAVDNRDVLATIARYDRQFGEQACFYVDPPYFGVEHYYEASKQGFPHRELAELLNLVKGKVALSYYPDPRLDEWYAGWHRLTWEVKKTSQIQLDRLDVATELLLTNYLPPIANNTLWDVEESEVVA